MAIKVNKRSKAKSKLKRETRAARGIFISLDEAFLFLVSAVRYALGRKSYIVGWTCGQVRSIAPRLKPHQQVVLIRSIMDYGQRHGGDYGSKWDKDSWLDLVGWLDRLE